MINKIIINKNRGWRGLAELKCYTADTSCVYKSMIFSFSQDVWVDMQLGHIVIEDEHDYTILHFNNTASLPKGQRSVVIGHFMADVLDITIVNKSEFTHDPIACTSAINRRLINHFIKNTNNHTTSNWNYVGLRVIPKI